MQGLYCFDAFTGRLLWNYSDVKLGRLKQIYIYSNPTIAEGYVFALGALSDNSIPSKRIEYLIIFGKFKKSSSISLFSNTKEVGFGEEISLELKLLPGKNTNIVIETRYAGENWKPYKTLKTNEKGELSFKIIPNRTGYLEIKGYWEGDKEYSDAFSNIVRIYVKKVTLQVNLNSATESIINNEYTLKISVLPKVKDIPVRVEYISPFGKKVVHLTKTNNEGNIVDNFIFNEKGEWDIKVTLEKTENTLAVSKNIKVLIKEQGFPYMLIIIIIAILVAVSILFIFIRRKQTRYKGYPTTSNQVSYVCSICGTKLVYVSKYGRWYCPKCERYF